MTHHSTGSHDGEDLKTKARETASSVKDDMSKAAQSAAQSVQDEAAHYADRSKEGAAREVRGVASALRTAADELRDGSPQERTFSQLADGLADVSDTIRDKDLGEMVGGVNSFARRNPLLFLGGAALAGFAATRFARASSRSPRHHDNADRATSFGADLGGGSAGVPTATSERQTGVSPRGDAMTSGASAGGTGTISSSGGTSS
ncbi:hypothetical protein ACM25N_11255 [Roseovarius sp. C7]|uniref:hypothetical protein n=1 Tax=Roseovarius sp. C7 TaxID=3398643 RepID=UPI0039F69B65